MPKERIGWSGHEEDIQPFRQYRADGEKLCPTEVAWRGNQIVYCGVDN